MKINDEDEDEDSEEDAHGLTFFEKQENEKNQRLLWANPWIWNANA